MSSDTEVDPVLDLGPLPSLTGYALRRAQLAVFADFHAHFAPLDLRPGQFSVLLVLRQNPGARPSRVADALGIKRANFAPLLTGLLERGLVERSTEAADRRAQALHLTPAGYALLEQADAAQAKHEARMMRRIGADEYATLLAILARLA